jgi:transcriptional regulator with XRE-family HTH domain
VQDIPIGERIRLFRLGRGMTQEQLAGLADVSPSWLSKAERGVPLDRRMGPLSRIAGVLGVGVGELVGQRLALADGSRMRDGGVDALRRALVPPMVTPGADEPVDLRRLVDDTAEASRLRHAGRSSALGAVLPGLIARGEQARRALSGQDRASACEALVTIYTLASKVCEQLGETELALASAMLARRVVEEAGSPILEGIVARRTSFALVRIGAERQALDLSTAAAQQIETAPRTASADEVAVHGALMLTSAYLAAHTGDAASAWTLLAEAERDAHRFGLDRVHVPTSFALGNVLWNGADIALELGDPRSALRRAQGLDPSRLLAGLPQIHCYYWVDVARAQASLRRPDDALGALLRAEQAGPEAVRFDPEAREVVRELLRRKRQSVAPELRRLAGRLGMTSN